MIRDMIVPDNDLKGRRMSISLVEAAGRRMTGQRLRWGALALIVTAQFMVILDVAIVNVALPSIKSD